MIREPAWDQLNSGGIDEPRALACDWCETVVAQLFRWAEVADVTMSHEVCRDCARRQVGMIGDCAGCGDVSDVEINGEKWCQGCAPHDCSDDPCDRCNPYSGAHPW